MPDIESMTEDLLASIEGLIEKRCAPFVARADALQAEVDELKARAPVPGPKGDAGERGEAGSAGADGVAGKDGRDGIDGKDGAAGLDGKSVDADAIEEIVQSAITKQVAAIPKAIDGRDGRDGQQGLPGLAGKDGAAGLNGLPGIDGRDGFGLEDFAVELKDDRTLVFKFARGEITKECEVVGTWPVDMGPFKVEEGAEYKRGDGVSYKGCWWIAQAATSDVPGTSKAWRMAVKAGRDGKDFNPAAPPQREPMRLR